MCYVLNDREHLKKLDHKSYLLVPGSNYSTPTKCIDPLEKNDELQN